MSDLNERIAEWAGLECRCRKTVSWKGTFEETMNHYWGKCPRHSNGGNPPDYSQDEVAIGLLLVLRSKGFTWVLQDLPTSGNYTLQLGRMGRFPMAQANENTIAAAICAAVKRLMEAEK